jgi:F-type H+-transporting ATPase subunit epsilon
MAVPTIHVDVVSAEEQIYSGEAEFVVLRGVDGELGVYPRHTPLFTAVRPGAVRIKLPGEALEEFVFVQGGFLEVQPNHVTVLADTAIRAADLDEAKALEAMREAEDVLKSRGAAGNIASAQAELAAAAAQIAAIRKLKHRT